MNPTHSKPARKPVIEVGYIFSYGKGGSRTPHNDPTDQERLYAVLDHSLSLAREIADDNPAADEVAQLLTSSLQITDGMIQDQESRA